MTDLSVEITIISRLASRVAAQKALVTQDRLSLPDFSRWHFKVRSQADLIALVTECYKWWREGWTDDIQFLMDQPLSNSSDSVRAFNTMIRLIRTAHQHSDNQAAQRFYERWLREACGTAQPKTENQWLDCGRALGRMLVEALTALGELADAVSGDREQASSWRARSRAQREVDPTSARERVAQDLGLNIPRSAQGYLDRQITFEWNQRIRTVRDDPEIVLDSVVERSLVGWALSPLPCPHSEILDELDCWADARASAALTLAHAIAELADYRDNEDFLGIMTRLWSMLISE